MEYLFSEKRFVYKDDKGTPQKGPESVEAGEKAPEVKKETKAEKEARLLKEKTDKAKRGITDKAKQLKSGLRQKMGVELFAQNIDSVKKLREKFRTVPIGLIGEIEDKYPGLTLAAFTTHLKGTEKLDLKTWSSDKIYSKFKPGTKYAVNFLGNSDAEDKWGLSDMLSITMRKVTKYEGGNERFKRVSLRRIGLKGQNKAKRGFYDDQGYMAIHTGDAFAFENTSPEFRDLYRKKTDGTYKEIDEESYRRYAESKHAQEDAKFLEKQRSNRSFVTKRASVSREKIIEIREKIGGLEGLSPQQRITKVALFLTKPENNIGARHCGDWVDRVYAIAGVKRKKTLYQKLNYAFVGGNRKNGWKSESDPSRHDCRKEGVFASGRLLDGLQPGDWLWVNNRNKFDRAGNHSVIFLEWVDKSKRRARVASWFGNTRGRQKISVYNFKNMPVTAIRRATHASDDLPEPRVQRRSSEYIPNAEKRDLIARGSAPFPARVGYTLTPEEYGWYRSVRREAHKMARLGINRRLSILQEKYKMMDALKHSADMVGLRKKDWNFFLAMNDATQYVESSYNTFCSNQKRVGRTSQVHLSTAAGEYQILNSVWKNAKKYTADSRKGRYYRRQMRKYGIDPEKLMQVDITAPRPELATPFQRCVVHNLFTFRYSRILKRLESIDNIFDRIRSTSGRERRSWIRAIYLYWRNGPGGAAAFIRNLRNGILMPETSQEMEFYYHNHLNRSDWQHKRGYRDFKSVMGTTKKFVNRFERNLGQM